MLIIALSCPALAGSFSAAALFPPSAVYKDGKVCISILHEAKADEFNTQEKMSEKWRPILGPEAVLVSVLSMLSDPNFESPANIDASVREGEEEREREREKRHRDVVWGRWSGDPFVPASLALIHLLVRSVASAPVLLVPQVEAKNDPKAYKARVRKLVRDSLDSL